MDPNPFRKRKRSTAWSNRLRIPLICGLSPLIRWTNNSAVNFPTDKQRLVIVGATGSGKTQAGMWHLSKRNFLDMPWVIYDFKGDELIDAIEGTQSLDVGAPAPTRPGIYVVRPHPAQKTEVENQLWEIWAQENIGIYVDEGLMIGKNNNGFRAALTQGRSKYIPMIVLSQRPVWMDNFVFSESEYFQVFRLQKAKDLSTVNDFIPYDLSERLPEYHSYYYSVPHNEIVVLEPVPDRDAILDTFHTKLRKLKKVI